MSVRIELQVEADLAQIGAMIGLGELLSALMEQNRAHHAELLAAIDEVL